MEISADSGNPADKNMVGVASETGTDWHEVDHLSDAFV